MPLDLNPSEQEDVERIKSCIRILRGLGIGFFEFQTLLVNRYGITYGEAVKRINAMELVAWKRLERP